MSHQNFNTEKAISVLLYISSKLEKKDFHKIFKILYFADQKHLSKYGRQIVEDDYVAMKKGPVPSKIYDILKLARQKGNVLTDEEIKYKNYFEIEANHIVNPKSDANMEEFSDSDLECLDESILENGSHSFDEMTDISHDGAYNLARTNGKISILDIAKVGGATEEMVNYIKTLQENRRIFN